MGLLQTKSLRIGMRRRIVGISKANTFDSGAVQLREKYERNSFGAVVVCLFAELYMRNTQRAEQSEVLCVVVGVSLG